MLSCLTVSARSATAHRRNSGIEFWEIGRCVHASIERRVSFRDREEANLPAISEHPNNLLERKVGSRQGSDEIRRCFRLINRRQRFGLFADRWNDPAACFCKTN